MDRDSLRVRLEQTLDVEKGDSAASSVRRLRIELLLARLYAERACEQPNHIQRRIAALENQTCEQLIRENREFDAQEERLYTARLYDTILAGLNEEREQPTDLWRSSTYELMAAMTALHLVRQGFNSVPVIAYRPIPREHTALEAVRHRAQTLRLFYREWRQSIREVSAT